MGQIIMKKEITQRDLDRFWRSVEKRGEDECWGWKLCSTHEGYALFTAGNSLHRAQRFAYNNFVAPLKHQQRVSSSCKDRQCCNLKHLYTTTQGELLAEARERGTLCVGSKNRASKLQEADILAIRARYKWRSPVNGLGGIGADYGVSPGCVRDILIRKTWRHV